MPSSSFRPHNNDTSICIVDDDGRSPSCEGSISPRWCGMTNDVYKDQIEKEN